MSQILDFSGFLNEGFTYFPEWKEGGILLIKGIPMKDGKTRLYATRVSKVYPEGIRGFFKAQLYRDFYIIMQKFDGSFIEGKIDGSLDVLGRAMGLKSYAIGLNAKTGKTPIWQDSIKETNFSKFLKEWGVSISELPGVHFPPKLDLS
jgi:hypothetical protein